MPVCVSQYRRSAFGVPDEAQDPPPLNGTDLRCLRVHRVRAPEGSGAWHGAPPRSQVAGYRWGGPRRSCPGVPRMGSSRTGRLHHRAHTDCGWGWRPCRLHWLPFCPTSESPIAVGVLRGGDRIHNRSAGVDLPVRNASIHCLGRECRTAGTRSLGPGEYIGRTDAALLDYSGREHRGPLIPPTPSAPPPPLGFMPSPLCPVLLERVTISGAVSPTPTMGQPRSPTSVHGT